MPMPSPIPSPVPRDLGYCMPAEWGRHEGTWLAWPHERSDWPGKYAGIPWIFAEIVRVLAVGERVHIFVQSARAKAGAEGVLEKAGVNLRNVCLLVARTDRVWTRDSGPVFVRAKKQLGVVDFKFNAWAKYDNSRNDDRLAGAVGGRLGVPVFTAYGLNDAHEYQRFVLEGGSIDVNGAGCVLTTEECLLSKVQQRNPGFSRERIEETLAGYLGIEKVLWLGRGIAGDDTHGHVDDIARFVGPTTIVAAVEGDRKDANHAALAENLGRLRKMRDGRGRAFNIVELPLPGPVVFEGQRLPASYANFYIANVGVLVPVFNDPGDLRALKILEGCFRDRPIIPVYCRDLVLGLGTLHCMTQQQPAVVG